MIHSESVRYNWLVHRVLWDAVDGALRRYATGVLVDIGCGIKPYAALTDGLVKRYVGLDHPDSMHDQTHVDLFGSAYATPLSNETCDTALCTFVLEHLERPEQAIREIQRILKPGGHLILAAPLFWHLHEEPRDFFRYTRHGLEHLLVTSGLDAVELRPLSGFIVTFLQEACYYVAESSPRVLRAASRPLTAVMQWTAYLLHRWGYDKDVRFTWAYLAVARKRGRA